MLNLTEADPDRRPTAHAALSHPWFRKNHIDAGASSPKNNPVNPNATIPAGSPEQSNMSHNLMTRMNNTTGRSGQ